MPKVSRVLVQHHGTSRSNWYLHLASIVLAWILVVILVVYLCRRWIWPNVGSPVQDQTTAPPMYKGRGYCSETAAYVMPTEYPNFVSQEEADYILNKAKPDFSESKIVSGMDTNVRKSQTAWLMKTDPVVSGIIQRVCDITSIPFEHAEKMQVVRYEPNGYYNEHHDASCDDRPECVEFEKNGGQRKITMLIYLSDDYEGGATRFPKLERDYKMPKYGAILFHPLERDGNKCHPLALHAGLPVTSGTKYIANVWLRERPYNTEI